MLVRHATLAFLFSGSYALVLFGENFALEVWIAVAVFVAENAALVVGDWKAVGLTFNLWFLLRELASSSMSSLWNYFRLEYNLESCANPICAIHFDFSSHFLNHFFAYAQPKPRTFFIHILIKPWKICKKFVHVLLFNSHARISNLNSELNKLRLIVGFQVLNRAMDLGGQLLLSLKFYFFFWSCLNFFRRVNQKFFTQKVVLERTVGNTWLIELDQLAVESGFERLIFRVSAKDTVV